jgi:hypothetical protein
VVAAAAGHQPTTVSNLTIVAGTQRGPRCTATGPTWRPALGRLVQPAFVIRVRPRERFDISLASGWEQRSTGRRPNPGGPSRRSWTSADGDVTAFAVDPGATCGDDDSASTGG